MSRALPLGGSPLAVWRSTIIHDLLLQSPDLWAHFLCIQAIYGNLRQHEDLQTKIKYWHWFFSPTERKQCPVYFLWGLEMLVEKYFAHREYFRNVSSPSLHLRSCLADRIFLMKPQVFTVLGEKKMGHFLVMLISWHLFLLMVNTSCA